MIDFLDNLLRQLFISQIADITLPQQVRFQPPDDQLRSEVKNINAMALNAYLIDVRENRMLRSNERVRTVNNGLVSETQAPRRVDCHYLVTAWSPADDTLQVEATVAEHALLYQVIAALTRSESLVPREIYAPAPLPATFPAVIADEELPTTLLPFEGFPKYAEFWGTMGTKHPWKPAAWLVVTLPVVYGAQFAGPMVSTRIAEFRMSEHPETAEVWIQIGGQVFDAANPPALVSGAWVRLMTPTDEPLQITQTNDLGRFTFNGLRAGNFRLRYQAPGLTEKFRDVEIPSPSGEYDLQF
jgi:Pvc16 N-terminal domain